ncbi:MAG: DUF3037 domain-containing protein [Haliangium ochraceum]
MPASVAFEYALIRIVPDVTRGERLNAGIILYAPSANFLGCELAIDVAGLLALAPRCDARAIAEHLEALRRVAAGDPGAGPIASLVASERFHWLVAPRSTIIQVSRPHVGVCEEPEVTLRRLLATLVERE